MISRTYKTGVDRAQATLLPACVEDYVGADNPVRAIEAYVDTLDLAALGFGHAAAYHGAAYHGAAYHGAGQPPYDPGDCLKLYLYGYLNRVRSSRALARETGRNLEAIWLLRGLRPGYRTIASFREDNAAALNAAGREFVLLARELGLIGAALVAIDGSFFRGDASKASISTKRALEKEIASIAAYAAELEAGDAAEDRAEAAAMARRRSALVEHPFGTLKCRAGWTHFLVRGFEAVSGEWSLMALVYNLARVLRILGLDGFRAALARLRSAARRAIRSLAAALKPPRALVAALDAFLARQTIPAELLQQPAARA